MFELVDAFETAKGEILQAKDVTWVHETNLHSEHADRHVMDVLLLL